MNKDFDEKEHQEAVKMLRWLDRMAMDCLLDEQGEPDLSIDHHALALERCPLSLTVCKVIESLNLSTTKQWKLRNHIDPDLPIFLSLLPKTGESFVAFPTEYKRVIACDVFDRNPLTFTVNQDKTLYEARLTPEQTKTVFKALRINL